MKSNAGVAEEVRRLLEAGGILRVDETKGCGNAELAAAGWRRPAQCTCTSGTERWRRTAKDAGLKSTASYYPIVDFLLARCREQNGAVDRALMEGRRHLPKEMTLKSDCQVYTLN